jgi:hypothetical protein
MADTCSDLKKDHSGAISGDRAGDDRFWCGLPHHSSRCLARHGSAIG